MYYIGTLGKYCSEESVTRDNIGPPLKSYMDDNTLFGDSWVLVAGVTSRA